MDFFFIWNRKLVKLHSWEVFQHGRKGVRSFAMRVAKCGLIVEDSHEAYLGKGTAGMNNIFVKHCLIVLETERGLTQPRIPNFQVSSVTGAE